MNTAKEQRVQKLIISPVTTLLEALKVMDAATVKLLLVCEGERFAGVLSIGDIQRAILASYDLKTPVAGILRKGATIASTADSREEIAQAMIEKRIECMPVIDAQQHLAEVIFWDELFSSVYQASEETLDLPVVIMAGGKGSRLKPFTNIIPKPLIPIGEKPIIELIIDRFHALGCRHFHISVNYKHEMIRAYFAQLEGKDYEVDYFMEPKPLGTAGSLYLIRDQIKSTFFVSNCDIIIDQDYHEIYKYHKAHSNLITLVGSLKHYNIPYGTLETGRDGELLALVEKPDLNFLINSGMYILEPSVLDYIVPDEALHITDLIEIVKKAGGRVGVFPVSEGAWMDIGEWKEYNRTMEKLGHESIKL